MSTLSPPVDFSALIYGSMVTMLLEMTEEVEDVNTKLEEIGYRIGLRLAHEFARDRNLDRVETAEALIRGVLAKNWDKFVGKSKATYARLEDNVFKMSFEESIFTQNVTVPEIYKGVKFEAILPGILKGVFEIFHFEVNTSLVSEEGSKTTDVKIEVVKAIPIAVPKEDD